MCDTKADGGLRCANEAGRSIVAAQSRYERTGDPDDRNTLVERWVELAAKDPEQIIAKRDAGQGGPGGLPNSQWDQVLDKAGLLRERAENLKAVTRSERDHSVRTQWAQRARTDAFNAAANGDKSPALPPTPKIADNSRTAFLGALHANAGWTAGVTEYARRAGSAGAEEPATHPADEKVAGEGHKMLVSQNLHEGYLKGLLQRGQMFGEAGQGYPDVPQGPASRANVRAAAVEDGWLSGVRARAEKQGRAAQARPSADAQIADAMTSASATSRVDIAERVQTSINEGWESGRAHFEANHEIARGGGVFTRPTH